MSQNTARPSPQTAVVCNFRVCSFPSPGSKKQGLVAACFQMGQQLVTAVRPRFQQDATQGSSRRPQGWTSLSCPMTARCCPCSSSSSEGESGLVSLRQSRGLRLSRASVQTSLRGTHPPTMKWVVDGLTAYGSPRKDPELSQLLEVRRKWPAFTSRAQRR